MNNSPFYNPNVKVKSIISIFVVSILLYFEFISHINFYVFTIILLLVSYISSLWIINFKISLLGMLSYISFIFIYIFSFNFFIFNVFVYIAKPGLLFYLMIIFLVVIFLIFLYSSFLNLSIIDASYIENVPLAQFSYTSNYVISLFVSYLFFIFVLANRVGFAFSILVMFVGMFVLSAQFMWNLIYASRDIVGYSLIVAFIMSTFYLVALFIPQSFFITALFLTVITFIYDGIIIHYKKSHLSQRIFLEYTIIFIIVFILFILLPGWGIAGGIR